ncbi:MAG: MMPL family transporter [Ktedonobacteraceae bacterium]
MVPIFAFVFLVSLGEDFNILTIARIREEVQQLGQRKGIATAIALTGGVVSVFLWACDGRQLHTSRR